MSFTTKSDRRWSALALIVVAQFMVILDIATRRCEPSRRRGDAHERQRRLDARRVDYKRQTVRMGTGNVCVTQDQSHNAAR